MLILLIGWLLAEEHFLVLYALDLIREIVKSPDYSVAVGTTTVFDAP